VRFDVLATVIHNTNAADADGIVQFGHYFPAVRAPENMDDVDAALERQAMNRSDLA